MTSSYRTISASGESLYKVKGSKHLGFAMAAANEEGINVALEQLRKAHHTANHVCYAWRLGIEQMHHRANDDGEPANSAGMPILGQIEKYELTHVLVAVVRYFGGTKLGVGGLIDAYRSAAQMAIESATIEERHLMSHFKLYFPYERMSEVMLAIRVQGWASSEHDFRQSCAVTIALPPEKAGDVDLIFAGFDDIRSEHLGIF